MSVQPEITMIPAKKFPLLCFSEGEARKKRVAAYARVSTDMDEQVSSYEAQIDYYTKYIHTKEEWVFVEVYTDEGISATNTKHREGFNRMIAAALDGKIDLILTKSVSRFARNTVDTLTTVRKLKAKNVEVFFEKENIYTLDSKGELLITIMSSLAQEESRSISENVTWGQRKRFADGKVSLPYKAFLGYKKGANGLPEIIPEQAKLVKYIYKIFLDGNTPQSIANTLMEDNIPTANGRKKWYASTILSILKNEKYKGDALLQKTFTIDFLTKTKKANEGEVPQYYVENSHPAIIEPKIFDTVQKEIARRKEIDYKYKRNFLSGKLICADCGALYTAKTWHSTDKYRRTIWRCSKKYADKEKHCSTLAINEEAIKEAFIKVFNTVVECKDEIITQHRLIAKTLTDTSNLEKKLLALKESQEVNRLLAKQMVEENARKPLDQTEYDSKFKALEDKADRLNEEMDTVQNTILGKRKQAHDLNAFLDMLEKADSLVPYFNEELWNCTVETVTVFPDGRLLFKFHGGLEREEKL